MEVTRLLSLAVLLACASVPGCSSIDVEACKDLGFSSSLLCSSCDKLKRFKLEAIEEDCRQCCQETEVSVDKVELVYNNDILLLFLFVKVCCCNFGSVQVKIGSFPTNRRL